MVRSLRAQPSCSCPAHRVLQSGGGQSWLLGARAASALDALRVEPFFAVGAHPVDDRQKRATLLGERVLNPRRNLRVGLALAGISPRTLSLRLRALEEEGIVERHTFGEVPPRVEYALTEKGRALLPIVEGMRSYGEQWLGEGGPEAGVEPLQRAALAVA
jgi:DNA-binding HxlR family transcriptional regulator